MTRVQFYKRAQKIKVIDYYTNGSFKCACCEEANIEFLTIDHINNDGSKHRKIDKEHGKYSWIVKNNYPEGFQILCMNCNFSKGIWGFCPHKHKSIFTKEFIKKAKNVSRGLIKGEKHPASKLTKNDVKNIRKSYNSGVRIGDLVKQYLVCRAAIYKVVNKQTWAHVK